ncbi:hypothetical protein C0585_03240 [Candidatus Woesearchaeota archaeon]|nr:MAG: hypothetical protein C0585_03240 [Candidatus Woesearchaeota archaeon]
MSNLVTWFKYIRSSFLIRMAYRGEFLISLVSMFALEMVGPLFAYTIYLNSPGFAGWTFYQIILLQGILLFIKGFSYVHFFGIVWNSNISIWRGTLDFIFLKPRNLLLTFIFSSYDVEDNAKMLGGIALIGFALYHIEFTFTKILLMIYLIILGIVLFFAFALLFSAFIIRFIQTWRLYEFLEIILMIAQYPNKIYPQYVSVIFTSIIPLFVAGVFPAEALIGSVVPNVLLMTFSVVFIFSISLYTWFNVLKHYSSAGG